VSRSHTYGKGEGHPCTGAARHPGPPWCATHVYEPEQVVDAIMEGRSIGSIAVMEGRSNGGARRRRLARRYVPGGQAPCEQHVLTDHGPHPDTHHHRRDQHHRRRAHPPRPHSKFRRF
jgi:hypothetical protein